jgi:hypothetical protein
MKGPRFNQIRETNAKITNRDHHGDAIILIWFPGEDGEEEGEVLLTEM